MFVPYLYTEHACAYSILCKIAGICRRLFGMFDGLMKVGKNAKKPTTTQSPRSLLVLFIYIISCVSQIQ